MSILSKRQLDDTSASNHPETDAYDSNYNCYDTGDCNNWWYSDVRLSSPIRSQPTPNQAHSN